MTKEILLIDDDAITNFVNQTIMASKFPGIPTKLFHNGAKAMEYILENPSKHFLVFLDLNMPIMSGWEFLSAMELKKVGNHIEIHVLTSSIDPKDELETMKFPMVSSFMEKPLQESDLDELVFKEIKKNTET
jgi:response regulator RpfG family c-di-GMP phosphodiesterase